MKNLIKTTLLSNGLLFSFSSLAAPICSNLNPAIEVTKADIIYTQNADGSVTDESTGLIWAKCSLGLSGNHCENGTAATYNWKDALDDAAQNANLHGKTDWRLPNVAELSSLTEKACYSPAINENIFPNTQTNTDYWTSTPREASESQAWTVHFNRGWDGYVTKGGVRYVRLVRDAD